MVFQVVSSQRHRHARWQKPVDSKFASTRHLVGLSLSEVGSAALSLPLTFVCKEEQWSLCALLGLNVEENLYLTPSGEWICSHVPAVLRYHPFQLGWEEGRAKLCVDEGSGLIFVDGPGEAIFVTDDDFSDGVKALWASLSKISEEILILENACEYLAHAGILEPWPITIEYRGQRRTLEGPHRINETALNRLDASTFISLREAGVLPIVFAQLLSMGNLRDLGRLAQMHAEAAAAERARAEVKPMIMLPEDSSIDWDWSKIGKT